MLYRKCTVVICENHCLTFSEQNLINQVLNIFWLNWPQVNVFFRCWNLFQAVKLINTFPMFPGLAVKNLPAFHLLQASLLRSQDSLFCCQLLRTLQTIWEKDPANFFLLEWTVQSMAQLATCVWRKPAPVQKLFFSMLKMVESPILTEEKSLLCSFPFMQHANMVCLTCLLF